MKTLMFFICFVTLTSAYPHGAPTKSCQELLPHHKKVKYHYDSAVLSAHKHGSSINVTITSDRSFKGFILNGRDADGNILGTFQEDDNANFKLMECNEIDGSSITHKDKHHKNSVNALWEIPEELEAEKITFKGVVVYSYKKAQKLDFEVNLRQELEDDIRIFVI